MQAAAAAQLAHQLAVHDAQLQAELVAHLIAPLDLQARGTHHQDGARAMPQQQLLQHQPGLDGLAQTHVIGDEQIDARHLQRAHHWIQLIILDGDAAAKRRVQVPHIGRRHRAPAHRIEERIEPFGIIEALRRIGQRGPIVDPRARLDLPDHLQLLAQAVILHRLQAHPMLRRTHRERRVQIELQRALMNLGNHEAPLPDRDELAGTGHRMHGTGWGLHGASI